MNIPPPPPPDPPGSPDELLATPRPPIPPTPIVINTPGTGITTEVEIEDENPFIIPTTRKRGPETPTTQRTVPISESRFAFRSSYGEKRLQFNSNTPTTPKKYLVVALDCLLKAVNLEEDR
ncbi:hypothetical protein MPH_03497 [Macrophomina phaseolina MS6]|uniref:Uncharacterized protein n=1 Tax=Macrophomina phaseolina (strain MS6) TaxID=1126212 RepID=K2R9Q9_MACPH|nr:hypothetical protein MPH_03497 [Macrophomina phaseolina MS6]